MDLFVASYVRRTNPRSRGDQEFNFNYPDHYQFVGLSVQFTPEKSCKRPLHVPLGLRGVEGVGPQAKHILSSLILEGMLRS